MRCAALVFGLLLLCTSAQAAWDQKYSECGDDQGMAVSVSSPDGQHVFACGTSFAVSNPFTDPTHRVLFSEDGGESWRGLPADGLSGRMLSPVQVFFIDADTGWLLVGGTGGLNLARTVDRGAQWTESAVPEGMSRVHFFDAQNGVAVGSAGAIWQTADAGAAWNPVSSQASVDLKQVFFVDRQHGFACGNDSHEEGEENLADAGQVIATSDGGQSWQLVYETSGQFLSKMHFQDATNGWMCAGDNTGTPYLMQSTNGGAGWDRKNVPTTVSGYYGKVTAVTAVRFFDSQNGRAVGVYDTGMSTSQGGQMYMIADYKTTDGGGSWDLHVNDPGSFPDLNPPEGAMLDALFYTDRLAWAVGTGLRICKEAPPCQTDADCFEGFFCDGGTCRPNTSGPCVNDADCYGDYVCRDGTCGEPAPGPCQTDDDCPGSQVCQHGHCVDPGGCDEDAPVGQQGCPFGQICVFGTCIQDQTCESDDDCTSTQRCYQGRCYPDELPEFRCLDDSDCAAGEECVDTWCEPAGTDGGADSGGGDAAGGDPGGADTGGTDAGADGSSSVDADGLGGNTGGGCGCGPAPGGLPAAFGALLMFVGWALRRRW